MNSIKSNQEIIFDEILHPCIHCGSVARNVVYEKPPCPHYAAQRCGRCDAFQKWLPKPENLEKQNEIREVIGKLIQNSRVLNDSEYVFISGMKLRKKFTPRQLECIEAIGKKYSI
ncbi:MAG: hypothetical protein WBA07_20310 [Rivularia sp. (in: cyanobacteria)]